MNKNLPGIFDVVLGVLIFSFSMYMGYMASGGMMKSKEEKDVEQKPQYVSRSPVVNDLGRVLPTNFPRSIPIEDESKITESYEQDHFKYNSAVVAWDSAKNTKENYALYLDILTDNEWEIVFKENSPRLSSLYAKKEANDINIVIKPSATNSEYSQVNITHTAFK